MCTGKPKVPKPEPVIQRQAYKSPAPRESLSSSDAGARRRRAAGVVTSAQGDTSQASTTRKAAGGDQKINPSIGGGMGASVATAPSASAGGIVTAPPVIQAMAKQRSGNPLFWKYGIDDGGGVF